MKQLRCHQCGTLTHADATFCESCGERLHRGCSSPVLIGLLVLLAVFIAFTGTCAISATLDAQKSPHNDYATAFAGVGWLATIILLIPAVITAAILWRRSHPPGS